MIWSFGKSGSCFFKHVNEAVFFFSWLYSLPGITGFFYGTKSSHKNFFSGHSAFLTGLVGSFIADDEVEGGEMYGTIISGSFRI